MPMKASAPGKLLLSGEWAVLEVGNPAIVTAVDKRVWAEIEANDEISVFLDDFRIKDARGEFREGKFDWTGTLTDEERDRLKFCRGAIEACLNYLGDDYRPFWIRSWGEMSQLMVDGQMKKIGFGSSAASVVAFVGAILRFHGMDITKRDTKDIIYKLSTIAHYLVQGKVGSAFDVAASTYGGVFVYTRFDPKWLAERLEAGDTVREIVEQDWPGLSVEELEIPQGFDLLVGWTRDSASTSAMVKDMNVFKQMDRDEYDRLFGQIASLVREVIPAWRSADRDKVISLLRRNEEHLRELGEKSRVNIETPALRKLSEAANQSGGAGKLSGAGGGDCGIAVSFDPKTSERIRDSWKRAGLFVVDAKMDPDGVR